MASLSFACPVSNVLGVVWYLPDIILSMRLALLPLLSICRQSRVTWAPQVSGDSAFRRLPIVVGNQYSWQCDLFRYGSFYSGLFIDDFDIAEGVKYIGNSAFQNCSALNSITMAGSVESIGDYAFWNCQWIENFISYASYPPKCKANAFVRRFESPYGHLFTLSDAVPALSGAPGPFSR